MFEPWKCPYCATWLAPGVTQHRCDDPPSTCGAKAMLQHGGTFYPDSESFLASLD